jgi:hypothetical protein
MSRDRRYGNERSSDDDLVAALARANDIDAELADELLDEARRRSADDEYGRSISRWFEIVLAERSNAPSLAPGRRTLVESTFGSPSRWRAVDPSLAPGRRARTDTRSRELSRLAFTGRVPQHPARPDASARAGEVPFRHQMETGFGESLEGVEVVVAGSLPRGARGAAEHERITFADESPSMETVAHEVAHVLQFRRGTPLTAAPLGARGDTSELEATRAARDVVAGRSTRVHEAPTSQMHLDEPEDDGLGTTFVAHAVDFALRGSGLEIEVMWYALVWQEGREHAPLREGQLPPPVSDPHLRTTTLVRRLEEYTALRILPAGREELLRRRQIELVSRDAYSFAASLSADDLRRWFGPDRWRAFLEGGGPRDGLGSAEPPAPEPEATITVDEVLRHLADDVDDVDDLAARLTDRQMRSLNSSDRVALVAHISAGTFVLNDDERTIVRLLSTTPPVQALAVRDQLGPQLLQQLDDAIDFDDFRDYNDALRQLFFNSLTPEEAEEQMSAARVFPWANPGLIHALWNVRFYYDECELHDDGKVHISYWMNLAVAGIRSETVALDPFEMIAVHFLYPEEFAGAERGQTVYMPAINLRSLHRHQFRGELQTAVDVGLLFAGGAGLVGAGSRLARAIAALDVAMAAADITIRDFRHDIANLQHGPDFLAAWDVVQTLIAVYGVARLVSHAPAALARLRAAFQRFRSSSPTLPADTLGRIESEVDDVLRSSDEAAEASTAARRSDAADGADATATRDPAAAPDAHVADPATPITPLVPPPTIRTAEELVGASHGRPGLPDPLGQQHLGHPGDHIPPDGGGRAGAMAHARLRPNKMNTTVYYVRRHAMQDLRDALASHADEIAQLAPGQTISFRFGTPLRPGFNSVRGAEATEVSFDEISVVLQRFTTGELHLVQFTPRLQGL